MSRVKKCMTIPRVRPRTGEHITKLTAWAEKNQKKYGIYNPDQPKSIQVMNPDDRKYTKGELAEYETICWIWLSDVEYEDV